MSDQQPSGMPDEQPTQPLAPTPALGDMPAPTAPTGGPAPRTTGPTATAYPAVPAIPTGPTATAYPSAAGAPAGPLPPRRGMPGWAIAAAVVGGFALLGGGFAGGLGTGLLLSRNDDTAVQRVEQRGEVLDRLGELAPGTGRRGEGRTGGTDSSTPTP